MRTPSEAEVAYCAGLFEGEGCIGVYRKYGVFINIKMTDREPLDLFAAAMGGTVMGPFNVQDTEKGRPRKPVYNYRIGSWIKVIRVANLMLPWLSPRRTAKITEVLAHAPEHPRGELACPAEPFASYLGYSRHRQLGIPVCGVCRASVRLYDEQRRKAPGKDEYQAAYRAAHREEAKAKSRAYWAEHRAELNAKAKARRVLKGDEYNAARRQKWAERQLVKLREADDSATAPSRDGYSEH